MAQKRHNYEYKTNQLVHAISSYSFLWHGDSGMMDNKIIVVERESHLILTQRRLPKTCSRTGVTSHTKVKKTLQESRKSSSNTNHNRISKPKIMAMSDTRPVYYSQAINNIGTFEEDQQGCQLHNINHLTLENSTTEANI